MDNINDLDLGAIKKEADGFKTMFWRPEAFVADGALRAAIKGLHMKGA